MRRSGGRLLWGSSRADGEKLWGGGSFVRREEGVEPRMFPRLCAQKTVRRLACQVS